MFLEYVHVIGANNGRGCVMVSDIDIANTVKHGDCHQMTGQDRTGEVILSSSES